MPNFEVVSTTSLFTGNQGNRRNGLRGEYFNSSSFDGKKHQPRERTYPSSGELSGQIPANPQPLFARIDPQVNFRWWDGAPRSDMNDDDFGVRWTGYLSAPVNGTYQLGAIGMNAFELYFDGKLIVDFSGIHEEAYRYAPVQLEAGKLYAIRLDYHEFLNDASIRLVWSRPPVNELPDALAIARKADAVVMVLGLSPRLEGEEMKVPVEGFSGGDRLDLNLPRTQEDLLKSVAALGKPSVLVLLNGSALAVNWARDNVPAIVEAWYPGQAGGAALADVLFGDYNPAGRLPVTFYKSVDQLPAFTDYEMKGRMYRFFEGAPLFPFGFGLSYTTFHYQNLKLPDRAKPGDEVKLSVEVTNGGNVAGEEVVQVYLKSHAAGSPIRSLAGFRRIALQPKERKQVQFTLTPRQFATATSDGRWIAGTGDFEISVGGAQPVPGKGGVSASLRLEGPSKDLGR